MADDKSFKIIKVRSFDGGISQVECHEAVTSTALLAKKYANAGYPDRYTVFSRAQTEVDALGEGLREGQASRGLFLSCILRPSMFPSQAGLLRILSGVALITALEEYTTKRLGIGWVSDIFCEGRKIGGVSLEGKLDNFSSYEYIIVSFHLRFNDRNFPPRLCDMVERVFENENTSTELIVAKNIISKFFPLYFNMKNKAKFMDVYKAKFCMRGLKAKYVENGKKKRCRIINVDMSSGSLLISGEKKQSITVTTPTNMILPKKIKL